MTAAARSRPRHPRNGHTADCPYPSRDPRTCPICRGERLGRPDDHHDQAAAHIPLAAAFGHATTVTDTDETTACPRCYTPTTPGDTHACT